MTQFGFSLMCELHDPRSLVQQAQRAEQAGFDFVTISDHFHPWLYSHGHSPYAWSVLGGVAATTERLRMISLVTCPTIRYHPAIVAQKAATMGAMSDGRFELGLGAGENLNEHVVGRGWPPANVRHEMLAEAVRIIRDLLGGGYVNFAGTHFRVDSAKLWDLPEQRVPIAVAVSGKQSVELFAPLADAMIAVEPDPELSPAWNEAGGAPGARRIGQLPLSYGTDRTAAVRRAREQFRWFSGGWKVNAELPGTAAFAAASQYVTEDDVAEGIPCGDDVDAIVRAVGQFAEAGFTDVALVQIGGDQQEPFLAFAEKELLPALRGEFG
jgi:G6PDH family F420-dependent oxidoreductase